MIMREIIKDTAQESGWTIVGVGEAANGQEAVQRHAECQPDVMTLDLVMPEYDGLHALRNIMKKNPDAKVLIVSALDQQQVLKEALGLGASDFIVKPFEKDHIVSALESLLSTG